MKILQIKKASLFHHLEFLTAEKKVTYISFFTYQTIFAQVCKQVLLRPQHEFSVEIHLHIETGETKFKMVIPVDDIQVVIYKVLVCLFWFVRGIFQSICLCVSNSSPCFPFFLA